MNATRPQDRRHALGVDEIERMLRQHGEQLFFELFPAARRDGHHLCIGSIAGEPGQSLKMELRGLRQGCWHDFANPDSPEGHGDCIRLIELVMFAGDRGQAVQWAKSWLNLDDLDPGRLATKRAEVRQASIDAELAEQKERELKRKRAVALWMGAKPIAGTPAAAYLRGRAIELDPDGIDHWPGCLRFEANCYNREEGVKMPAMVAQLVRPDGTHAATHRTYLTYSDRSGWVKMDSPNAKMMLGSARGAFVPLRKGASGKAMAQAPAGEFFYVAEGIEDGLVAAMARPQLRIGAGYSLGNIGAIELPEAFRAGGGMVILADRDAPGSKAVDQLEATIAKQQARGIAVRLMLPPQGQKDLNAWLQGLLRTARVQARAGGAG